MATKKVKVYRYAIKPEKTDRRAVSILLKALLVILAVILVAAAGFWFKCRVMDGRSFMAGFVDLFLTLQHRSDKFRYIDSCEAFIKEIRESGRGFFEYTGYFYPPFDIVHILLTTLERLDRIESFCTFI